MGGGSEDLYSDTTGADATPPDKDAEPKDDGRDTEEAILPRTICPHMDLKVGDKLELEVTQIHDKEISVKYSQGDEKGEEGEMEGGEPDKAAVPAGMGGPGDGNYD